MIFFDNILAERADLGQTGQIFLTDKAGLSLSNMPLSNVATSLVKNIEYDVIAEVVSLNQKVNGVAISSFGQEMMVAAVPLNFLDQEWVIVAEKTVNESLSSVHEMRDGMIWRSLIVLLIAAIIAIIVSRSITKPQSRLIYNCLG